MTFACYDCIHPEVEFYKKRHGLELSDLAVKRITAGIDELKSRAKTLLQFVDESAFYAKSVPLAYDDKAKEALQGAAPVLEALKEKFLTLNQFTAEGIQTTCKDVAAVLADGKLGKVAMPLRGALTGTTASPSVFHAAEILGLDETLARIDAALH